MMWVVVLLNSKMGRGTCRRSDRCCMCKGNMHHESITGVFSERSPAKPAPPACATMLMLATCPSTNHPGYYWFPFMRSSIQQLRLPVQVISHDIPSQIFAAYHVASYTQRVFEISAYDTIDHDITSKSRKPRKVVTVQNL